MASILNKNITRISSTNFDNREVLITLTEDQRISLKLKGLKKGEVSISIKELYEQLSGSKSTEISADNTKKKGKEYINLSDLRSKIAINSSLDYKSLTIFEKIVLELIKG